MTAISTIISLYKEKYFPIGMRQPRNRRTGGNGNGSGAAATGTAGLTGDNAKLDAFIRANETALKTAADNTGKWATSVDAAQANINVGLAEIDAMHQQLNSSIVDVVRSITLFEERESELTKVFQVGTKELALRTKAYNDVQIQIKATNDQMVQYRATMEINSSLSGKAFADNATKTGEYVANTIKAYNFLTRTTEMTADQQANLELYSAGAGRSLVKQVALNKAISDAFDGQVASSTTMKLISSEIAGMSADIRQQYKGTGGALEIAVMRSKKLGVSMAQIHKTGESLLNIEASVGKELEYQLISGKRLVDNQGNSLTNMYRQAMMSGKAEDMQNAMSKIFESQQSTLEGNNYLAKQALAESLGMSQQELMAAYEKKKLQEQVTAELGNQYDIEAAMKNPAKRKELEIKLKEIDSKKDSQLAKAFENISEADDRSSPAQRILTELRSIRETGLNVKIDPTSLEKARTAGKSYKTMATGSFQNFTDPSKNQAYAEMIGRYQIVNKSMTTFTTTLNGVIDRLPYLSGKLSSVVTKIDDVTKALIGVGTLASRDWSKGVNKTAAPAGSGTTKQEEDAILSINDGIISSSPVLNINDGVVAKFHPNDKITTVVASPYGAMNERIAGKIANPKPNNSSGAEITQLTNAINSLLSKQATPQTTDNKSIVSAIQTALGNVSITVALDPMAIDKEIKFRSGNLNKASI